MKQRTIQHQSMLKDIVHRHLSKHLVSSVYTEAHFIDTCTKTIPGFNYDLASKIYKEYEQNDTQLIDKITDLIDNKLLETKVQLEREQLEDSVMLKQLNQILQNVDTLLQEYLNQLGRQLGDTKFKLEQYAEDINNIQPVDTQLQNSITELMNEILHKEE